MPEQLAPHEQRVLDVVESVLAPLVAEGRAELDVASGNEHIGAIIEITPTREDACPVKIRCEAPGDLDLFVGRYKLTTHIWSASEWKRGDFAALERHLREFLIALVAGRYREEVRLIHDGRAGKGRGIVDVPGKPWRFTYSRADSFWKRGPWQQVTYSAY
jgi:hypothetical protein